jgi:hypothetical protein
VFGNAAFRTLASESQNNFRSGSLSSVILLVLWYNAVACSCESGWLQELAHVFATDSAAISLRTRSIYGRRVSNAT